MAANRNHNGRTTKRTPAKKTVTRTAKTVKPARTATKKTGTSPRTAKRRGTR